MAKEVRSTRRERPIFSPTIDMYVNPRSRGREGKQHDGGLIGPRSFNAITGYPGHLIRVGADDPCGNQKPKVIAEPWHQRRDIR